MALGMVASGVEPPLLPLLSREGEAMGVMSAAGCGGARVAGGDTATSVCVATAAWLRSTSPSHTTLTSAWLAPGRRGTSCIA